MNRSKTPVVSISSPRATVEILESRRLLSASLHDGVLEVNGTAHADKIYVGVGEFSASGPVGTNTGMYYEVSLNGKISDFPAGNVQKIVVHGGGGDDIIALNGGEFHGFPFIGNLPGTTAVTVPAVVHGDGGNDDIVGGSGTDKLYGDAGNDSVAGWTGSATLYGGAGNDMLGGQPAFDTSVHLAVGGAGNDTLIGTGPDSILPLDTLFGGAGKDMFYSNPGEVADLKIGETRQDANFTEPG